MFTDKSQLISCLINSYNHKIFIKAKHVSISSSLKMNFTGLHINVFLGVWSFSSTDDIAWPFDSEKLFLQISLSFDVPSTNWSKPVCLSTQASSKIFCFGFRYFGPLEIHWRSFSSLKILRSPAIILVILLFWKVIFEIERKI